MRRAIRIQLPIVVRCDIRVRIELPQVDICEGCFMWRYMAGFWDRDDLLAFRLRCVVYELIEIFVPSGLNKSGYMIFI